MKIVNDWILEKKKLLHIVVWDHFTVRWMNSPKTGVYAVFDTFISILGHLFGCAQI